MKQFPDELIFLIFFLLKVNITTILLGANIEKSSSNFLIFALTTTADFVHSKTLWFLVIHTTVIVKNISNKAVQNKAAHSKPIVIFLLTIFAFNSSNIIKSSQTIDIIDKNRTKSIHFEVNFPYFNEALGVFILKQPTIEIYL